MWTDTEEPATALLLVIRTSVPAASRASIIAMT